MFEKIFSQKKKTLSAGLSLEAGIFRFVVIEDRGGVVELVDAISGDIPPECGAGDPFADDGAALDSLFKHISASVGRVGCSVNFVLPLHESQPKVVRMEGLTLAEARSAIRYELENYFITGDKESIIDADEIEYPISRSLTESRFVSVFARRPLAENIMRSAKRHGMKISAIEPAQIAIERTVSPSMREGCQAYIFASEHFSSFMISWNGNGIFYRAISADLKKMPAEGAEYESAVSAFADEVVLSLQYYISDNSVVDVENYYLGGCCASDLLRRELEERLGKSVTPVDAMKLHGLNFPNRGEWDIAFGAALDPESSAKLDLRPNKNEARNAEASAFHLRFLFASALVFFLFSIFTISFGCVKIYSLNRAAESLTLSKAEDEERLKKLEDERQMIKGERAGTERRLDFAAGGLPFLELLTGLQKIQPPLVTEALTISPEKAVFSGAAADEKDVLDFCDKVQQIGAVRTLSLPSFSTASRDGIIVKSFKFEAALNPLQTVLLSEEIASEKEKARGKAR